MKRYYYRAVDHSGRIQQGVIRASNKQAYIKELDALGLQQLPYQLLQQIIACSGLTFYRPNWEPQSASLFFLHLSQLLTSGVPLLDALEELTRLEQGRRVRKALGVLREQVNQGDSLSDAMQSVPTLFKPNAIALVQAGESSAELARCLEDLSAELSWQADIAERIKTALAYPVMSGLALIGIFIFLLFYMVPSIEPFVRQHNTSLPIHTQLLLALSDGVRASGRNWLLILSLLVGVSCFACFISNTLKCGVNLFWLQHGPGRITLYLSVARYARTLGVLQNAGVSLVDSLSIAEAGINSAALRQQLEKTRAFVLQGFSLEEAMKTQSLLPPLFIRLVAAGESTGLLENAFNQASVQLQGTAKHKIERMEKLLGPAILCVLGVALAWLILAVLGPVYSGIATQGLAL